MSQSIRIPDTRASRRVPYKDDYGTCSSTFAVLVVRSQSIDVRRIGEMLGLEATEATSDGYWVSPIDLHPVGGLQRWALSSAGQVSSRDVRRHLDWLLDRIEPAGDALAALRQMDGVEVEILCPWISAHGQGGPTLWPEQMARLAALGLRCLLSVGFEQPAEDSHDASDGPAPAEESPAAATFAGPEQLARALDDAGIHREPVEALVIALAELLEQHPGPVIPASAIDELFAEYKDELDDAPPVASHLAAIRPRLGARADLEAAMIFLVEAVAAWRGIR